MTIRAPLASCVILAAAAFMLGALIPSHADARTLARVDGVDITDEDVKLAAEDIGSEIRRNWKGPSARPTSSNI